LYFRYKKYFSILLLILVDANYKFIAVDLGVYGSCTDGGALANSSLGAALTEGALQLNPDKSVPHVTLGDEAFPLNRYFLRPYSRAQLGYSEQ
jgi:hypothetical protein